MKTKITLSLVVVLHCFSTPVAFAKQPALANYSTVTKHDCINYECEKSLYKQNKLEIIRNNISLAQSDDITKHINAIQTSSSSFPGFTSTVLWKIPKNMTDKALHCHKAKPQKLIWKDSSQQSITLKYRHECWQFVSHNNKTKSHKHKSVVQVKDVVYTIKITRKATSCLSSLDSVHPNKFECIPTPIPEKLAIRDKQYTLVPLEEVTLNPFISIKFDDDVIEFVLVDILDELDTTVDSGDAAGTQSTPEDTNTEPPASDPPVTDPPASDPPVTDPPDSDPPVTDPPDSDPPVTDPAPESGDDDSDESEHETELDDDSDHEEHETELEHDSDDSDHEEHETELEHDSDDSDHEEHEAELEHDSDDSDHEEHDHSDDD